MTTSLIEVVDTLGELAQLSIEAAEAALLGHEQVDCPVIHHFGPGIYIRELHMKAGILAIGHHQKFEHVNVILKGKVVVLMDDGTTKEISAPMMYIGKPGRKIGWVLEDIVWQNIYATELTDIEELEAYFLNKSAVWSSDAMGRIENAVNRQEDRDDYALLLRQYDFTEESVREQTENFDDQIPMPHGSWTFKRGQSTIQGMGIFATSRIDQDCWVGPARLGGMRTPLGRFVNHSKNPNARMVAGGNGDIVLMATKNIQGCVGGQDGEEITIDYRQTLELSGLRLEHQS